MISALGFRAQAGRYLQAHNRRPPISRIAFLGCSHGGGPIYHNIYPKVRWVIASTGNRLGNLNDFLRSTTASAGQQVDGNEVIAALAELSINGDESGNQIVPSETLHPKVESADNSLVLANRAVNTAQSVGNDFPKDDLHGIVRAPTPAIPIPSLEHSEWNIYIVTASSVSVKTVRHDSPFRIIRRGPVSGFPGFAYLPSELRIKIVSPILTVFLPWDPPL